MGLALTWVGLATWEVVVVGTRLVGGGGGGKKVMNGWRLNHVVQFGHRRAVLSNGHTTHALCAKLCKVLTI